MVKNFCCNQPFRLARLGMLFWIVLLLACSRGKSEHNISGETEGYKMDLQGIVDRGELVVLMENSASSYFIYRGRPMGYEYEVLEMFAEHLGVKLKVKVVHNLDQIITKLNKGEGDIIACNYTVTAKRSEQIDFSDPYLQTKQVLVQRKPEEWREMRLKEIDKVLVRNALDLRGKTVHVWENSSYYDRLLHLNEEIGGGMQVVPTSGELETEELIRQVAEGKIDYTVVDKNIGRINARFYPNIDIRTPVSLQQQIAFGLRKNSPNLLKELNKWLGEMEKNSTFNYLKHKYFDIYQFSGKSQSEYASTQSEQFSKYDDIIREESRKIGWDWLLVASIIYQESKFDNTKRSWAGAFGIMQLMPSAASRYGITPGSPPQLQIRAGLKKLKRHYDDWVEVVVDTSEAVKFTLATYNAGLGHVKDAQRLTRKYGGNDKVWEGNVEEYLLKLSKHKYYADPVVRSGYMRGIETYEYVHEVLDRYENYQNVYQ